MPKAEVLLSRDTSLFQQKLREILIDIPSHIDPVIIDPLFFSMSKRSSRVLESAFRVTAVDPEGKKFKSGYSSVYM